MSGNLDGLDDYGMLADAGVVAPTAAPGKIGYKLQVPNQRAYDPTQVENTYAQALAGKMGGDNLYSFAWKAEQDRLAAGEQYSAQLNAANKQQYDLGLASAQAEQGKADATVLRTLLTNPDAAARFGPTRRFIDPNHMPQAEIAAAGQSQIAGATAREKNSIGLNQQSEAGYQTPEGTPIDRYGVPQAPAQQGLPRDLAAASLTAEGRGRNEGGADTRGWAQQWTSIDERRADNIRSTYNSILKGDLVFRDSAGTVIRPEQMTEPVKRQVMAYATQQADVAANAQRQALRSMMQQGGYGHLIPDTGGSSNGGVRLNPAPLRRTPPDAGGQTVGPRSQDGNTGANTPRTVGGNAQPQGAPAPGTAQPQGAPAPQGGSSGGAPQPIQNDAQATKLQTFLYRDSVNDPGGTTQRLMQIRRDIGAVGPGTGYKPYTNGTVGIVGPRTMPGKEDADGHWIVRTEKVR